MVFLEKFVSETLGLKEFPPYLPTFYGAFFGFLLVHQVLAPYFSNRWFPVAYGSKGRASRNNWSIHVVSQVHALIIVPCSLWFILHEDPTREVDRAFGWDPRAGHIFAIACGYFLWDSLDAVVNFIDAGFVAHGIVCFFIYLLAFKPFVAYYGTRCLLWETSTIFLNNHWFLDKLGHTGSRVQAVNGGFLLSSFFFVRMVYGGSISVQFFFTLLDVRHEIPLMYLIVYGSGNFILQGLNWFWFYKMISALRKRFDGSAESKPLLGQNQGPSTPAPEGTS